MSKTGTLIAREKKSILQSYHRLPVAFARGKGAVLFDEDGKAYLDFICGISVTNLGHAHPVLLKAMAQQAAKLSHVGNLAYQRAQVELAEALLQASGFASKAAFANTGAEANELMIKVARRFGAATARHEILAFHGGFHGRTFGALSASGQVKLHKGMEPLLPGFKHVPYNDLDAARRAVTRRTAAILVEPILGENGIVPGTDVFLVGLRRLADRNGLLLMLDEIQTGLGRSGPLFAFQHLGHDCVPDVMSLGKSLGGGLPLAAVLLNEKAADAMALGQHGTTLGGNPVACAAGLAQLKLIQEPKMRASMQALALQLKDGLLAIQKELPGVIRELRGQGLMFGVVLNQPSRPVVEACLAAGLLVNATADHVIRLQPPFNLSPAQARQGLAILKSVLSVFSASKAAKASALKRN